MHPRLLNPGLPLQGALPVVPSFSTCRPRLNPNASTLRTRFVLAIEPSLLAGWVAVYLDGWSELAHGVRIGGFGVCSDNGLSFSAPLPLHDPQTNIRMELWAALWALRRHQPGVREVFRTDRKLVFWGVTRGAARWRRHGWRNASGPISHVDIWEQVWELSLRFGGEVCRLKVPAPSPMRAGWTAHRTCCLRRLVGCLGAQMRTTGRPRPRTW